MIHTTCLTCFQTATDSEYIWARTWADQHMQQSSRCFNLNLDDQFVFKVQINVTK